jgi:hypothetical protein
VGLESGEAWGAEEGRRAGEQCASGEHY